MVKLMLGVLNIFIYIGFLDAEPQLELPNNTDSSSKKLKSQPHWPQNMTDFFIKQSRDCAH